MKKALITGVAGFIGSHLAESLLKAGYAVMGVDNLSTGRRENIAQLQKNKSFRFVAGDDKDSRLMEELVADCDTVYHLAAVVGVKLVVDNPVRVIEANVAGCSNVLKSAAKYKRKIFLASSSEVYGKLDRAFLREDDDLRLGPTAVLRWSYCCTKLIMEYLGLGYHKTEKLPVVIGRFFNVCGPRQTGAYGMVVPRFVRAAFLGEPITVYGDGQQTRSFTYVDDAVRGIIGLMKKKKAVGQVFNIGNPRHVTINELAELVKEVTRSSSPIVHVPYKDVFGPGFEDMPYRVPDITKITKVVGFRPQVELREIIEKIVAAYKLRAVSAGKL